MLNTLFEPTDIIEIRCLHKDQIRKNHKYEPEPRLFWGTPDEIRNMNPELQRLNVKGYNIYFGINPRLGKSKNAIATCRTLCVDLDGAGHSMDFQEAEGWLEVAMFEWSIPYPSVKTCSGNGIHYFWRLSEELSTADWSEAQKALIATFNLTSKIADPVIHDAPRIMRLPGFLNHRGGGVASVLENCGTCIESLSSFRNCYLNLQAAPEISKPDPNYSGDNSNALARALKYFELRNGSGEGGRNTEAYKISACCQNDFALSESDCYYVVSVWNQKNNPPLPESEIREVIGKAKSHSRHPDYSKDRPKTMGKNYTAPDSAPVYSAPASSTPASSNNDYDDYENLPPADARTSGRTMAGVDLEIVGYMIENYVLVAGTTEVWDLEHGIRMPAAALSLIFPREFKYWKTDSGRKIILPDNLVFNPTGNVKPGQINMFRGFNFQSDDRPAPLLLSHLEFICGDDQAIFDWVMSWCALQVQQPGVKIASSIIFHGKQGTGKSMFWECFGNIFAPYFGIIDQTVLESDFNAWASQRLFVLAEEVLASQSKSKFKNVIRQMITGGKIIINQKNIQTWQEDCYMNMVFNSNNAMPMILDEDDRRFMTIRCDKIETEAYYTALAAEIADNGPARLYKMLLGWDLQGFNAHTKPLSTQAKQDLISITRDSAKVFLDEWLAGDIDDLPVAPAKRQDLYDAYRGYCKSSGIRPSSNRHMFRVIREDYPQLWERKTERYRLFATDANADVLPFNEACFKYLYKIQDRRV